MKLEKIVNNKTLRKTVLLGLLSFVFVQPVYSVGREIVKECRQIDVNNDKIKDDIYVIEKERGYLVRIRYSDTLSKQLFKDTIELYYIKTNEIFKEMSMRDLNKDGSPDITIRYKNSTRIDYFINDGEGNFSYEKSE